MAENSGDQENRISPSYMVELGSNFRMYPKVLEFVIGRGKQSDLHISSSQVSRRHCEIHWSCYGWKLRNMSTSGTWINGEVLTHSNPVPLNDSDIILLGDIYIQCFLSLGNERLCLPVDILKINVLVGGDRCTLNTQPESCIDKNSDLLDIGVHAIATTENEIKSSEGNLMGNITKKSQEEMDARKSKESMLASQLDLLKKKNLILLKQLEDYNKAYEEGLSATKKANLELAQLKEEISFANLGIQSKMEETIETELQCSVCHEIIINATTLNCSHTFCEYCLLEWTKKKNICPICRTPISSKNETKVIDNFIAKILLSLPDEVQKRRQELVESRKEITKKLKEKNKPRKRRRTSVAASSGSRQAITITLQNLASLMDTTM